MTLTNNPLMFVDVRGTYAYDYQGKGWTQNRKDMVTRAQQKAATRADEVLKEMNRLVKSAQRLCEECSYRSPLAKALAETRVILRNTRDKLRGSLEMPLKLMSKEGVDGEYKRKECPVFGWIAGHQMTLNTGLDERATAIALFHEATHHAGGTDDGESNIPWKNAHELDELVYGSLKQLAGSIRNYLIDKHRRANCPMTGQMNAPTPQQWPNNP